MWTVFAIDVTCGYCGDPIPPNQPVYIAARRFRRCAPCARAHHGQTVNAEEVDLERHCLEVERLRQPAPTLSNTRPTFLPRPRRAREMTPASAAAGTVFDLRLPAGDRD